MSEILKQSCEDELGITELSMDVTNFKDECFRLLKKFDKRLNIKEILNTLPKVINDFYITYDKNYDKICCIFDRDKKSFTSRQYDSVLNICNKHGFSLHISNPCFEFWLLMHFEEVKNFEEEHIMNNKRIKRKNYVQKELESLVHIYSGLFNKSKYDAKFFIDRIDMALTNAKYFSEDNCELKERLGSSLSILIRELKN